MCVRIGPDAGSFESCKKTIDFHKIPVISCLPDEQLASHEEFCSTELWSYSVGLLFPI